LKVTKKRDDKTLVGKMARGRGGVEQNKRKWCNKKVRILKEGFEYNTGEGQGRRSREDV